MNSLVFTWLEQLSEMVISHLSSVSFVLSFLLRTYSNNDCTLFFFSIFTFYDTYFISRYWSNNDYTHWKKRNEYRGSMFINHNIRRFFSAFSPVYICLWPSFSRMLLDEYLWFRTSHGWQGVDAIFDEITFFFFSLLILLLLTTTYTHV
jgi:hypothetical protein